MQKVRAWGPGLHGGIVGRSADFVVESIGSEVGTLGKWRQLPSRFHKAKNNTVPGVGASGGLLTTQSLLNAVEF